VATLLKTSACLDRLTNLDFSQGNCGPPNPACTLLLYNAEGRPQNRVSKDEPIILPAWPVGLPPGG